MEPKTELTTEYKNIAEKLDAIDPVEYARTRNYVNGAVTRLSPYLSRGVISTRRVLSHVLSKGYALSQLEHFVKELCWRDYFQRVAQEKNIDCDITQKQTPVLHEGIPLNVIKATTGIDGIDQSIEELYQSGYMHNHCRMYTAALVCNIAKCHWLHPAHWMYYHLLDGDWASNACSWQWVAGTHSQKKYYANQENINRYTHTHQINTYLDTTYENLPLLEIPAALQEILKFNPTVQLPITTSLQLNNQWPTFIYNYYNLDPLWHAGENGNRILLLEPDFFNLYPISEKCVNFMLSLARNIPGIQVYVGPFQSFSEICPGGKIYYKEHPFNKHYEGIVEEREWIAPAVKGYYPSFFSYWKKVEQQLKNKIS